MGLEIDMFPSDGMLDDDVQAVLGLPFAEIGLPEKVPDDRTMLPARLLPVR